MPGYLVGVRVQFLGAEIPDDAGNIWQLGLADVFSKAPDLMGSLLHPLYQTPKVPHLLLRLTYP